MTADDLHRIMTIISAPRSLDILLLASSGPCTKTDVYRLLSGTTHILDTLDILETRNLILMSSGTEGISIVLTDRGHMVLDLLRWADLLLRSHTTSDSSDRCHEDSSRDTCVAYRT